MPTTQPHRHPPFRLDILPRRQDLRYSVLIGLGLVLVALFSLRSAPALALRSPVTHTTFDQDSSISARVDTADRVVRSKIPNAAISPADLMHRLGASEPTANRFKAMVTLERMGPAALPILTSALADSDASVRIAAIQVLGWQRATPAVGALVAATFDSDPQIREAAVVALGEIGDLTALTRLQQIQVVQTNFFVQQAAFVAEQKALASIAGELGIGASELQAVAAAPQNGFAFALTSKGMFTRRDGVWQPLDNVAFHPGRVLAISADGREVYLATGPGLVKSTDGGETWQPLAIHLPFTATTLVTAMTVSPSDSRNLYVALAARSPTDSATPRAIGVYASTDGGNSWHLLPGSPAEYVTNHLALDSTQPGWLFGATGLGTWRYKMSERGFGSSTH